MKRGNIPAGWGAGELAYFADRVCVSLGPEMVGNTWEQVNAGLTMTQREWLRMQEPEHVRAYFQEFLRKIAPLISDTDWNTELDFCKRQWRKPN